MKRIVGITVAAVVAASGPIVGLSGHNVAGGLLAVGGLAALGWLYATHHPQPHRSAARTSAPR